DDADLVLGLRLRDEIIDASFPGDRCRGQRIVAGDHDGLDAHAAEFVEALAHAGLYCVLQIHHANDATIHHQCQRGTALARDPLDLLVEVWRSPAIHTGGHHNRLSGALEVGVATLANAAHPRFRLE